MHNADTRVLCMKLKEPGCFPDCSNSGDTFISIGDENL